MGRTMAEPRIFWLGHARLVALRHNAARWLDFFLPAIAGLSGAAAAALLLLRQAHAPTRVVWWGIAALVVVGGVVCFLAGRRHFLTTTRALARLDDAGGLHNRLTSAQEGVGAWPAGVKVRDAARWNWRRIGGLAALSGFLLVGGALLPVRTAKGRNTPAEQPIGWNQVDSWIQALQDSKVVEPEAVQKLASQMDELRAQPPEKWYEQSSLEAGDSLRQQTEAALRAMQQDLQKAETVVSGAANGNPSRADIKEMEASLQQAVEGLEMGNLPLNKEMLKQLKDFKPGSLGKLSAEEIKKLEERLSEGMKTCERCVGPSIEEGKEPCGKRSGGLGGGGETAPLGLKEEKTDLKTKTTEAVSNTDLSHALPAEVLEVTATAPEVKPKASDGAIDGGSSASKGQGGEAVWRDSVTPHERELLQRFFK
jgi:hypothetical protein